MDSYCCPHGHHCRCGRCAIWPIPGPQGPAGATGIQGERGPRGVTGVQGPQGRQGPAGSSGLAATIEVEDASRVAFDNMPYVINVGTPHAAVLRFGIPAGMPGTPGERGDKGDAGDQGPAGEDGKSAYRVAVDNGYIGTESEWLSSLKGERGATGPIAAMIPFSISKHGVQLSVDASGEPKMIAYSGFSPAYYNSNYLLEGEWQSGSFQVRSDMPYPTSFIMTFNGRVKKIYVMFSTQYTSRIEEGASLQPFVCLAVSNGDPLLYNILPETIVTADPYEGGVDYPNHTVHRGAKADLDVEIPEGALVAIVAGVVGTGVTYEQSAMLIINGGIYLE